MPETQRLNPELSPEIEQMLQHDLDQQMKQLESIAQQHHEESSQAKKKTQRFNLLSPKAVMDMPDMKWLIPGLLPSTGLFWLYGPSGTGKSFLALQLAESLASGTEWFGYSCNKTPVVYICLEGSGGMKTRLMALRGHLGRELSENMHFIFEDFQLARTQDIDDLAEQLPRECLVMIDTQACTSIGLDENSAKDMGQLVESAKRLAHKCNGAVLLIHHTGKDTTRGGRGSSSLKAAMDISIEVTEQRTWRINKSKDGKETKQIAFKLEWIPLGKNIYGDHISSCVAVLDAERQKQFDAEEKAKSSTGTLSTGDKYGLSSLKKTLERLGTDKAYIDEWRKDFYQGHPADDTEAKRVAFSRVRGRLLNKFNRITVNDDYYSLIDESAASERQEQQVA